MPPYSFRATNYALMKADEEKKRKEKEKEKEKTCMHTSLQNGNSRLCLISLNVYDYM